MPSFKHSASFTKKSHPQKHLLNDDTTVSSWSTTIVKSFPTTHVKTKENTNVYLNEKKNTFANPRGDLPPTGTLNSVPITRLGDSKKVQSHHPDDAFFSGAWLFDFHQAPYWLKKELGLNHHPHDVFKSSSKFTTTNRTTRINKRDNKGTAITQCSNLNASSSSFTTRMQLQTMGKEKCSERKTLNASDSFLESGCWLFDVSESPYWFQRLVQSDSSTQGCLPNQKRNSNHDETKKNRNTNSNLNLNLNLKIKASSSHSKQNQFKEEKKDNNNKGKEDEDEDEEEEEYQFCSWLLDPSHSPEWFKQHLSLPSTSPSLSPQSKSCSSTFPYSPSLHQKQPISSYSFDEKKHLANTQHASVANNMSTSTLPNSTPSSFKVSKQEPQPPSTVVSPTSRSSWTSPTPSPLPPPSLLATLKQRHLPQTWHPSTTDVVQGESSAGSWMDVSPSSKQLQDDDDDNDEVPHQMNKHYPYATTKSKFMNSKPNDSRNVEVTTQSRWIPTDAHFQSPSKYSTFKSSTSSTSNKPKKA